MEDNKNVKKVIILLVILLCISVVVLGGSLFYPYIDETKPASLAVDESGSTGGIINPENTGDNFALVSADLERTKVALYRGHSEDKSPFNILNMSPGDKEYRGYELSVTYSGTVVVRFGVSVSVDESVSGYTKGDPSAKLADVLMVRVDIGGKTAYEGTLGKMPKELTYTLSSKEKTCSVVNYDVYAWLPKGAGEAYRQKHLESELRWWVAGEAGSADGGGQLEDSPPTGAAFTNPLVLISAASTAFFAMILVFVAGRKRKR